MHKFPLFTILLIFSANFNFIATWGTCPVEIEKFSYCPRTRPIHPATSAYRLHPGNVEIFASLGDSITAGLFMKKSSALLSPRIEQRGHSFLNGMLIDSIYSNLRKYHHNIIGGSKKPTFAYTRTGGGERSYNFAVIAAGVRDLSTQIDQFVFKLSKDGTPSFLGSWLGWLIPSLRPVNLNTKWKMINIFIGAIDLCKLRDASYFKNYLRLNLNLLRKYVKHAVVNLILLPDITAVYDITRDKKWCVSFQSAAKMCPPLFQKELEMEREVMRSYTIDYNQVMKDIAEEYAVLNDPGFAVLAQGGLEKLDFRKYRPLDVLSPADCFHPNLCTNRIFSLLIWNSLFTKGGNDVSMNPHSPLQWYCPSAHDYFQ